MFEHSKRLLPALLCGFRTLFGSLAALIKRLISPPMFCALQSADAQLCFALELCSCSGCKAFSEAHHCACIDVEHALICCRSLFGT